MKTQRIALYPVAQPAADSPWEAANFKPQATLAFLCLYVYLIMLYGRPMDYIRVLRDYSVAMPFAIAGVAAFGLSLFMGRVRFVWTKEFGYMAAITVWFMGSIFFSTWKSNSLDVFTSLWFRILGFFFLTSQVVNSISRIRKVLWLMIFCMFFTCATTFVMARYVLALPETTRITGMTGGVFKGNYLGISLGMLLPYMAGFFLLTRSTGKNGFLLLTFLVTMWQLVAGASRGNLIITFFTLMLVWLMMLRKSLRTNLLVALMFLAVVVNIVFASQTFWDRVGTLWKDKSELGGNWAQSAEASREQRWGLLVRSLSFTLYNPLFGVGLGNFSVQSGTATGEASEWKGTHNTYTQLSSEAGIPAVILVVLLVAASIKNMRRLQREFADTPEAKELVVMSRATEVGLLSFALSGFFAHFSYEFFIYQVVAIGVSLQAVASQMRQQFASRGPAEPAVEFAAATQNGRVNGRPW
jgi:O-antigen ligase